MATAINSNAPPKPSGFPDWTIFTEVPQRAAETGTGPPALALLKQTQLLPSPPTGAKILDNATGRGILTAQLLKHTASIDFEITAGDAWPSMLDLARNRLAKDFPGDSRYCVAEIDAMDTKLPDFSFTHVLMNFGPQLMSDPPKMLAETYRILWPGGTAGFTAWTKMGWLPGVLEAFPGFKPPAPVSKTWKDVDFATEQLESVGFKNIVIEHHDFETLEGDLDAYLELMSLLLPGLLKQGDNAAVYAKVMRDRYARGEGSMRWQALIICAKKV